MKRPWTILVRPHAICVALGVVICIYAAKELLLYVCMYNKIL